MSRWPRISFHQAPPRASLLVWSFRRAVRREILGISVAVDDADLANVDFAKMAAALALLHEHSARALDDLRLHTNGIYVWATAGVLAEWRRDARLIILEETYVFDEAISERQIASTLVHEATHARLDHLGFEYTSDKRWRIEQVCFRRELAFARRLPESADLVSQVQQQLSRSPDYFSSQAFRARTVAKLIELGVPSWLARAIERATRRFEGRSSDDSALR